MRELGVRCANLRQVCELAVLCVVSVVGFDPVEPQREKELEAFQEFMRPPDVKSLMEAYAGVEDYKVPYGARCRMGGKRRTEILCDDSLMRQKRSTAVAVARSASFLLSLRPEQRLAWGPVREYEDIDLPSAGSVFLTQPDSYEALHHP